MKKRLTAIITVLCLLATLLSGMILPAAANEEIPYMRDFAAYPDARTFLIETREDLAELSAQVDADQTMQGYTFLQVADITLEGEWTPIGLNPDGVQPNDPAFYTAADPFRGTYDGQGHTISNLVVNMPQTNGVGLFGCCYKATFKNIGIESGSVTGALRAGGIAGYADTSTIINCYNKANVSITTGVDGVGGIVGVARMNTVVYGCFNTGTISSPNGANSGIIGWGGTGDSITISGCYNGGKIAITDKITANSPTMDPICRNRSRETGDFSNSYYLAGTCSDDYNEHNATKLTAVDNGFLAYAMNHAQGYNNNAYTLDANGQLVFNTEATSALTKNQIKVYRDGVLLQTETAYLANNGVYTVPAQYNGETVDHARCNGQEYAVGTDLENNGNAIELWLEGTYPSVTAIKSSPDASIFTVSSAEELAQMALLVNAGYHYSGKTVYVTADLDFTNYSTWVPIGIITSSPGGVPQEGSFGFQGTFDGQYHHFKNIKFSQSGQYQSIFTYIESGAIQNIILDKGTIYSDHVRPAALVGMLRNSTLKNVENHVSVYCTDDGHTAPNVALVALTPGSTVQSAVNYGNIGDPNQTGLRKENAGISGYGYSSGKVTNCIVAGVVSGDNSAPISRGCTNTNCYYLPTPNSTGTMTYEQFLSGEAAWLLNTNFGTQENAGVWSTSPDGPVLDPDHATQRITYRSVDSHKELLDDVYLYQNAGSAFKLPEFSGYSIKTALWCGLKVTEKWLVPAKEISIDLKLANNTYKLRYELNGGRFIEQPNTSYTAGYSQALPLFNTLERAGYGFAGWYDNAELTGEPQTIVPKDLSHDAVYYAAWAVPTAISSAEELVALATGDMGGHYVLTADIDLTGINFTPIGNFKTPFTGSFDGNGHVISGLTINSTQSQQGLFGVNAGLIRNVTLAADCSITGKADVGGIVGSNSGIVANCISKATAISTATEAATYKLMSQNLCQWGGTSRKPLLKQRVAAFDPDIICAQEGSTAWVQQMQKDLTDYTVIYKYRGASDYECTPLAWKTSKFDMLESGHFWISETPEVESYGWDAQTAGGCRRICTWAVLRNKANGDVLAVYTIHLDHKGTIAKLEGGKLVKSRMLDVLKRYPGAMLLAAGDFNCNESSDAYKAFVSDGFVDARYVSEETSTLKTHGDLNNVSANLNDTIDFIVAYGDGVDFSKFQVLNELYSGMRLSDHAGVLATFTPANSTRVGAIAGSNSGNVLCSYANGTVSAQSSVGAALGRNSGTVAATYYMQNENGLNGVGEGSATGVTATAACTVKVAHQINQAAEKAVFTVKNGEYALVKGNDAIPVCITVNGVKNYSLSGRSFSLDTSAFTAPICALDGIYFEGSTFMVPQKDCTVTIIEDADCAECDYSICIPMDGEVHRLVCAVNPAHYQEVEHTLGEVATQSATCTEPGYTYQACAACGYHKVIDELPVTDHDYGAWTPFDGNTHKRVCSYDKSHVEYADHVYTQSTVEPGCGVFGATLYTCDCGYSYQEINAARLAPEHEWSQKTVHATCVEDGAIYDICKICNQEVLVETIDFIGHAWGEMMPVDDTTHQSVCAHDSHHIITGNHVMDNGVVVDPVCEKQGYTRYTCVDCGYYYDTDYTEALAHKWSEWVEEYPATATQQGRLIRTCALCNQESYRVLPSGADTAVIATASTAEEGYLTVTVELQNNPGLASLQLVLDYDPAILQIEDAQALVQGEALAGLHFTSGLEQHLNKGSFKLTWVGAANDTTNGTLFTLRFKVLQHKSLRVGIAVQPNTAYNADCNAVTVYDQDYVLEHVYIWNAESKQYICACGEVHSNQDINLDGGLDAADLVTVLRHLTGYKIKVIDLAAADLSKDGRVSIVDAVLLMRKLAA